jgi:hypothetical protein
VTSKIKFRLLHKAALALQAKLVLQEPELQVQQVSKEQPDNKVLLDLQD